MERGDIGGWLSGPGTSRASEEAAKNETYYPGERLGLPLEGRGSIAGLGRRVGGICVDWAAALLIANGLMQPLQWGSFAPLLALLTINVVLVGTAGFTLGHRLFGMRVTAVNGAPPGPIKALIRSALLCLVIPAVFWDKDHRGLHDQLAGTVLVRL